MMYTENILVSVIVPVYNEKNFLKPCIQSIMEQDYPNIEIILVDDGSIEEVAQDCDLFAESDIRIRVVHKENEGLSAARITGIKNSTGNWIMFVDDDDVLSPVAVSNLVSGVINSEIDIVAGGRVDTDDDSYSWNTDKKFTSKLLTGRDAVEMIPTDNQKTIITPLWGKIYKRSFLKNIDLLKYKDICPTIFFEDVLMTPILFYKAKKINIIHRVIYLHREVSSSISRSGKLTSFYYEQIFSGNELLEFSKKNELKKYYSYQLSIYMNSILRIYVLSEGIYYENYKLEIQKKYQKYRGDYLKLSGDTLLKKMLFKSFGYDPDIWRKCAKAFSDKKRGLK